MVGEGGESASTTLGVDLGELQVAMVGAALVLAVVGRSFCEMASDG